jgi:hypothetical protein
MPPADAEAAAAADARTEEEDEGLTFLGTFFEAAAAYESTKSELSVADSTNVRSCMSPALK